VFGGIKIHDSVVECSGKQGATPLSSGHGGAEGQQAFFPTVPVFKSGVTPPHSKTASVVHVLKIKSPFRLRKGLEVPT